MLKPFDSYKGVDPYIFVSYSHKDADLVYPEILWLKGQGFNIWYDEGISPGSQWAKELAQAIKGCYRFLFFVSDQSVASTHCKNEVHYAITGGAHPAIVNLSSVLLTDELEFSIGRYQALKYDQLDTFTFRDQLLLVLKQYPEDVDIENASLKTDVNSIAILPFTNSSNDPQDEYLCDGIADELLRGLANVSGVQVASRSSCNRYKNTKLEIQVVARQLKVNKILEGSFRRLGNRMRLGISLIDASTGYQSWSEKFDGDMSDVFELQDSIANAILSQLSVKLSDDQRKVPISSTRNLDAYRYYLKGIEEHRHYNAEALAKAIAYFKQAVELDPDFFDAHIEIVTCIKDHYFTDSPEYLQLAEESLRKANECASMQEQIALCKLWATRLAWKSSFDVETFERSARTEMIENINKKIDSQSSYTNYATILLAFGLFETSLGYLDGPQRDAPLDQGWFWTACAYAGLSDFKTAIDWFDVAIENDVNKVLGVWFKALSQNAAGEVLKTRKDLAKMLQDQTIEETFANQIEVNCLYWENRREDIRICTSERKLGRLSMAFALFALEEWDNGIASLKPLLTEGPNQLGLLKMFESLHPDIGKFLNNYPPYLEFMDLLGFSEFARNRMHGVLESIAPTTGVKVKPYYHSSDSQ